MQGPAEARGKTMRNILSFSVKDVSLALVAWQQIDDIVERERGERERERGRAGAVCNWRARAGGIPAPELPKRPLALASCTSAVEENWRGKAVQYSKPEKLERKA